MLGMYAQKIDDSQRRIQIRSSLRRCSVKKGALKNFTNLTGKHLYRRSIKMKPQHKCFPVKFAKFLRTPIYRTPPYDCFCKACRGESQVEDEKYILITPSKFCNFSEKRNSQCIIFGAFICLYMKHFQKTVMFKTIYSN